MGRLVVEYHGAKYLGRANWDLRDNQGSYRILLLFGLGPSDSLWVCSLDFPKAAPRTGRCHSTLQKRWGFASFSFVTAGFTYHPTILQLCLQA